MDSIEYIQVYGERNSGTNYLQNLLNSNVEGVEAGDKYGWKHGRVFHKHLQRKNIENVLFLAIFKDPYSWLVSMNKKPHHAPHLYNLSFSNFIRRRWSCYRGQDYDKMDVRHPPRTIEEEMMWERDPVTKKRFENVILMRNFKTSGFLHVGTYAKHFQQISYEDLLADPMAVVQSLATQFGLPMKEEFQNTNRYFGKNSAAVFDKKDFYMQKEYFNNYTQEDLDYVNNYLDEELEASIGYQLVRVLPEQEVFAK